MENCICNSSPFTTCFKVCTVLVRTQPDLKSTVSVESIWEHRAFFEFFSHLLSLFCMFLYFCVFLVPLYYRGSTDVIVCFGIVPAA